jgi:Flp pilus assembly protein CpaB
MRRNWLVIVFGVILMVGSFVAVLLLGQSLNPRPIAVVVAARDLAPGEQLSVDDLAVAPMGLVDADAAVIATFVTEEEVGNYLGAILVEPVYANQPVLKGALGDVQGSISLASQLGAEDVVAMVVPVTAETAPDGIRPGDYVDLTFSVVDAASSPVIDPSIAEGQSPERQGQIPQDGAASFVRASPTPSLLAPLAKTIVTNALVLNVQRERQTQTSIDSTGSANQFVVEGPVVSLVIQIPRDAQEVVQFALAAGTVRVTLLSALVPANGTEPGQRRPSFGMTWNDLVALLEAEREQRLAEGLPNPATGAGMGLAGGPAEDFADSDPQPNPTTTSVVSTPEPTPTARP